MIVLRVKMKQRISYGENKLHFGVLFENTLHLIPILKVCGFFLFENVMIFGIFVRQHWIGCLDSWTDGLDSRNSDKRFTYPDWWIENQTDRKIFHANVKFTKF